MLNIAWLRLVRGRSGAFHRHVTAVWTNARCGCHQQQKFCFCRCTNMQLQHHPQATTSRCVRHTAIARLQAAKPHSHSSRRVQLLRTAAAGHEAASQKEAAGADLAAKKAATHTIVFSAGKIQAEIDPTTGKQQSSRGGCCSSILRSTRQDRVYHRIALSGPYSGACVWADL